MSNILKGALNGCLRFAQSAVPHRCLLCAADSTEGAICTACRADLPWLPPARCTVCAVPLPAPAICGACLDAPPRYDRVEAVFGYRYPLDSVIQAYKYGKRLVLARPLGAALAARIERDVDVIVPMPLAPRRLAERGFNQALEIARVVAGITGLALHPEACRKVVETPPQAALPWKARARNVRRAFVCDADLDGRRVAVIDDVLTTGATLSELARVLRRAGAAEVRGWVVARTLPR